MEWEKFNLRFTDFSSVLFKEIASIGHCSSSRYPEIAIVIVEPRLVPDGSGEFDAITIRGDENIDCLP
jgi:hypothetical protein